MNKNLNRESSGMELSNVHIRPCPEIQLNFRPKSFPRLFTGGAASLCSVRAAHSKSSTRFYSYAVHIHKHGNGTHVRHLFPAREVHPLFCEQQKHHCSNFMMISHSYHKQYLPVNNNTRFTLVNLWTHTDDARQVMRDCTRVWTQYDNVRFR